MAEWTVGRTVFRVKEGWMGLGFRTHDSNGQKTGDFLCQVSQMNSPPLSSQSLPDLHSCFYLYKWLYISSFLHLSLFFSPLSILVSFTFSLLLPHATLCSSNYGCICICLHSLCPSCFPSIVLTVQPYMFIYLDITLSLPDPLYSNESGQGAERGYAKENCKLPFIKHLLNDTLSFKYYFT